MKDCPHRFPHEEVQYCALRFGWEDDRCLNLDYPEHCLEEEVRNHERVMREEV